MTLTCRNRSCGRTYDDRSEVSVRPAPDSSENWTCPFCSAENNSTGWVAGKLSEADVEIDPRGL